LSKRAQNIPKQTNSTSETKIAVRKARRADAKAIVDLIVGLAQFERLEPPDSSAKRRLAKDIFEKKLAKVLIASIGRKPVGYALYFYTYSSFTARPTLYLEDIFVREQHRQEGVGRVLFINCVREATRHGCGRMEWQVLTWNVKAMRFYSKLGARKIGDLRLFRLNHKSIQSLAKHTGR
jgi:GNAT superfamily N-acetyltransferase